VWVSTGQGRRRGHERRSVGRGSGRGQDNRACAHGEVELASRCCIFGPSPSRHGIAAAARARADVVHDDGECDGESDGEGYGECDGEGGEQWLAFGLPSPDGFAMGKDAADLYDRRLLPMYVIGAMGKDAADPLYMIGGYFLSFVRDWMDWRRRSCAPGVASGEEITRAPGEASGEEITRVRQRKRASKRVSHTCERSVYQCFSCREEIYVIRL